MSEGEDELALELLAPARSGGSGRKLQAEFGRLDTRVKISEMRRCWTAVSWMWC